ncbi:restriction endonuclease [Leptothrix discophora]|uniref:Restriction endonuclease n=1 Tax=Leptothrix discophora TaxID=89 RepID=A0ABT9G0L5_LEPDI|nr:restriction endonuclease [Leptothrix discophora]MDP4300025.1 restriction endonuclease [Leptothrix discophora]
MSRRRRSSPAERLLDLVSRLPWWADVLLALLSHVWLHRLAGRPMTAMAQPGQLGELLTQTLATTLASWGQYIVPSLCLAGAGLSAWRRRERRQLMADVVQARSADAVDGLSWQQFEQLVGEGFRQQGYRVTETGGGGADGGVDLVLTKGTEKFLVQCKRWRAQRVGVDVVRELYGVMAARGATGGYVVSSGRYTDDALAFAQGRNVRLIDGPRLQALLRQGRRASPDSPNGRSAPPANPRSRPPEVVDFPASAPSCPLCGKAMTRRTARRGTHAGTAFWGCTGYPACKGTRAMG